MLRLCMSCKKTGRAIHVSALLLLQVENLVHGVRNSNVPAACIVSASSPESAHELPWVALANFLQCQPNALQQQSSTATLFVEYPVVCITASLVPLLTVDSFFPEAPKSSNPKSRFPSSLKDLDGTELGGTISWSPAGDTELVVAYDLHPGHPDSGKRATTYDL